MDDGASLVEDSSDDDSDFSGTCTTTGHRKRRDDDSDLGRTRTATGQKKRSLISQTAAHREERLAIERLQHIPFFITSSYYTYTLPYTLGRCLQHRGGEPEQAKGADGMQLSALDCIAHIVDAEMD